MRKEIGVIFRANFQRFDCVYADALQIILDQCAQIEREFLARSLQRAFVFDQSRDFPADFEIARAQTRPDARANIWGAGAQSFHVRDGSCSHAARCAAPTGMNDRANVRERIDQDNRRAIGDQNHQRQIVLGRNNRVGCGQSAVPIERAASGVAAIGDGASDAVNLLRAHQNSRIVTEICGQSATIAAHGFGVVADVKSEIETREFARRKTASARCDGMAETGNIGQRRELKQTHDGNFNASN